MSDSSEFTDSESQTLLVLVRLLQRHPQILAGRDILDPSGAYCGQPIVTGYDELDELAEKVKEL